MRRQQSDSRMLVVNADDFGRTPAINRGVMRASREGIVTSASLMVRWPAAAEAADAARGHSAIGVGLHVDLGEWVCCNGEWSPAYEVVALDDREALAEEIATQLDAFRRLMGCDPTHLDSHQHVHLQSPLRGILARLAADLNVPLRSCAPHIHHCGSFYGQTGEGGAAARVDQRGGTARHP